MKIAYDPNQFDFEDGRVAAQFIGVKPFNNPNATDRDGNPMGPALLWEFVVLHGPDMGKKIGKITPTYPTDRNNCGRMIQGVSDRPLDEKHPFDSNHHHGDYYLIMIKNGKLNDQMPPRFVIKANNKQEVIAAAFEALGIALAAGKLSPPESEAGF